MLMIPLTTRINQSAKELADANDALNALCASTVVEQDEIEMCLANERLASAKRHFVATIQSAGIDPDTLRRAVEA